jgi:hypothetical protein
LLYWGEVQPINSLCSPVCSVVPETQIAIMSWTNMFMAFASFVVILVWLLTKVYVISAYVTMDL